MTTTIQHDTEEELHRKCAAILQAIGWCCVPPSERRNLERPWQVSRRLGVTVKHLSRVMRHPDCPSFHRELGPSGRVLRMLVDARFEQFIMRNIKRNSEEKP